MRTMQSRTAPSARFWSTSADLAAEQVARRASRRSELEQIDLGFKIPAITQMPGIVTPFQWDAEAVTAHRHGYDYGRQA